MFADWYFMLSFVCTNKMKFFFWLLAPGYGK
jgi:hypothetical protein